MKWHDECGGGGGGLQDLTKREHTNLQLVYSY